MIERTVVISHPTGLHARPAALFVQAASRFHCDICVEKGGRRANARSLISVLSLGAGQGSRITIRASGEDEEAAIAALVGSLAAEGT